MDLCAITGQFPGCVLANADLEFDGEFFELAYPVLDEFWNYNVKKRIPPEVPDHPKALDSLKRLYPKENSWTVTLNDNALQLANDMRALRAEARENDKEAKRIEAILRGQMGEASYGALKDGTVLQLTTVNRKGHTVEPKSFRQMTRKRY
jgi:predicted phage-related endonuclease